ncbi:hypothetical protein GCM10009863_48990 [Streptomyces axinellae]|uniref:Uncharacterized protein n=1 Tax=Streptomyces axinellae TaxID=552788 RepID=A0ABN3QJG6_9ACTN
MSRPEVSGLTESEKRFWEERARATYASDEQTSIRDLGGAYRSEFERAWDMGIRSAQNPAYARQVESSDAVGKLASDIENRMPATENYWYPADYVSDLYKAGLRFGGLMEKYGSRDAALQKNIDRYWQSGERPLVPEHGVALAAEHARNRLHTRWQDLRSGVAWNRGAGKDAGVTLGQESESMERLLPSARVRAADHLPQGAGREERSPSSSVDSTRPMPSSYAPPATTQRGAKRSSR